MSKLREQINLYLLIFGAVAIAFGVGIASSGGFSLAQLSSVADEQSAFGVKQAFAAGTQEAFDYLSTTKTATSSYCGLQPTTVDDFSIEENIQGACCGEMDFHRYQEQVGGLKKYSGIDVIPVDPYNIPVVLAKQLFEYQQTIVLDNNQQTIFDQAMEMSHEGGPCCCKCWRWTAFEGQAKFLISEYGWDAREIANLWDIQDGCGGPGHSGEGEEH